MQKAVVVNDFSLARPPWGLQILDVPVPKPQKIEVLVRLIMAPVHAFDNYFHYPKEYINVQPPAVPGLEGKAAESAVLS